MDRELTWTLFRVQLHRAPQRTFWSDFSPSRVLTLALAEKPTITSYNVDWHIGNVDALDGGTYFAIGRKLPKEMGHLDESGDFVYEPRVVAPYTHALLDHEYQVLAIASNADLGVNPAAIAGKIRMLLGQTEAVAQVGAFVAVDLIKDPGEFLQKITAADWVTKYQVTFRLPNVWDAEKDFQRPAQETAEALKAEQAEATFKGQDLDRGRLVDLTRAAVAVGQRAKAWIRNGPAQRARKISTGDDPVRIQTEGFDPSQSMRSGSGILAEIRWAYQRIRSSGQ